MEVRLWIERNGRQNLSPHLSWDAMKESNIAAVMASLRGIVKHVSTQSKALALLKEDHETTKAGLGNDVEQLLP